METQELMVLSADHVLFLHLLSARLGGLGETSLNASGPASKAHVAGKQNALEAFSQARCPSHPRPTLPFRAQSI